MSETRAELEKAITELEAHLKELNAQLPPHSILPAIMIRMDELEDQIFVFDGGYWKIAAYHAIVDSGNDFVTKRAGKIKPQVI